MSTLMNDLGFNLRGLAPSGSTALPSAEPLRELEPFTDAQVDEFREQDRWLPVSRAAVPTDGKIANVARIMKNALPPTAKVSKEAKECVQECVSEYIAFITSEAADKTLNEKRKTINGEDILTSMRALGFDNYEEVLKIYLAKYREHQFTQAKQRQANTDDDLQDGTKEEEETDGRKRKRKNSKRKG